jgi:hypothetical protein
MYVCKKIHGTPCLTQERKKDLRVSCSISILFVYMYVHMPSSLRSVAGVPSSRALPGYPITAPPPVSVPDVISALAVWRQNKTKKQKARLQSFRASLLLHLHLCAFLI